MIDFVIKKTESKYLARSGLTLVEVMIATVLAMLLMMSLATAFKRVGDSITENRAALQMSNQLRTLSSLLRRDLEMATANPSPPMPSDRPMGYLKIFEGPVCDFSAKVYLEASVPGAGRFGDVDDILMLTACSSGEWFTGKVPRYVAEKRNPSNPTPYDLEPVIIGSKYAEIIWYTTPIATGAGGVPEVMQLHRRVLLVRPDLNQANGLPLTFSIPLAYQVCDLSMRKSSSGGVVANTLEDLMYLENRFAHIQLQIQGHFSMPVLDLGDAFAFAQGGAGSNFGNVPFRSGLLNSSYWLQGDRQGEDVVMSNCLAFDLKVFDPEVQLYMRGTTGAYRSADIILSPNDPGYATAVGGSPVGSGDFVDLGWYRNVAAYSLFKGGTPPTTGFVGFSGFRANNTNGFALSLLKSGMVLPGRLSQITYDTWTTGYELDFRFQGDLAGTSIPQQGTVMLQSATPGRPRVDLGTNGLDDPEVTGGFADGLVDDFYEEETSAPFPLPLRSVKAIVRLEEPDTRQLQQISVVSEFITK